MKHLLLPILLLTLVSCREPASVERFLAGKGPFVYQVDMRDSTHTYQLDFYSRVDGEAPASAELFIQWTSPSGQVYTENAWLPLQGRRSPFSREVFHPYRAGLSPYEAGVWTLSVSIPSAQLIPGFRGLGLVVAKTEAWDTEN